MNKNQKKLANYNAQVAMKDEDAEKVPFYCMISPTADDALEEKDSQTVCSNRS